MRISLLPHAAAGEVDAREADPGTKLEHPRAARRRRRARVKVRVRVRVRVPGRRVLAPQEEDLDNRRVPYL